MPTVEFWTNENNPVSLLTEATMQCARYLQTAERISDSKRKAEELGCNISKPRITLIYGRSKDWDDKKKEQFRLLNSLYHNINILTYDLVLNRAKRIIDFSEKN